MAGSNVVWRGVATVLLLEVLGVVPPPGAGPPGLVPEVLGVGLPLVAVVLAWRDRTSVVGRSTLGVVPLPGVLLQDWSSRHWSPRSLTL